MKIDIECSDAIMKRVYTGRMGYNTQVSVPAGLEAVFVKGGQVVDVLRAGEHTINERMGFTLRAAPKETCELYAVCRAKPFDILWGVGGLIVKGKTYGASGAYRVTVDNPQSILRRFGFNETIDAASLRAALKGTIADAVREAMTESERELAVRIKERITRPLLDYGLYLDAFTVDEIREVEVEADERT